MRLIDQQPSPAKLNLFLHVTGQYPDGYHSIQSVFAAIDWYDTLHFEKRDDAKIQRHDLALTQNATQKLPALDLTMQAAHALQKLSGTPYGVDISIEKNIPMQAGLGGGSSNAATTLIVLNQLWQLNLSMSQLHTIALTLGSDVPFFLHHGPAWAQGRGEILTPIKLPDEAYSETIAVLKPAHGVSTQQIFTSPLLTKNTAPAKMGDLYAYWQAKNSGAFGFGSNDLQKAALAQEPQIGEAIQQLIIAGAENVRMTGSGSAVFGVIPKKSLNNFQLNEIALDWKFKTCKILDFHPQAKYLPRVMMPE